MKVNAEKEKEGQKEDANAKQPYQLRNGRSLKNTNKNKDKKMAIVSEKGGA